MYEAFNLYLMPALNLNFSKLLIFKFAIQYCVLTETVTGLVSYWLADVRGSLNEERINFI